MELRLRKIEMPIAFGLFGNYFGMFADKFGVQKKCMNG